MTDASAEAETADAVAAARDVLAMSPAERREAGIDERDVNDALLTVANHGDREDKALGAVTLPGIDLDYALVDGADRHPLDLTGATVEGPISAVHADVRVPVLLDEARIESLTLDEARFGGEFSLEDATVAGEVSAFETRFDGDAEFAGTTFEGGFDADEAVFDDDATFDDATFEGQVRARGAEFHGRSNLLDDNVSFRRAAFGTTVEFEEAEFDFCHFEGATFAAEANFQEARFDGDADFTGATFEALADFDETDFVEDATFEDVRFRGRADFRGGEFHGGARVLEDDLTFAGATFEAEADFRRALFRYVNFEGTTFEAAARFEEAAFRADADFGDAEFVAEADFDEARFGEDADFTGVHFRDRAVFRGAEFSGGANHLEDDARFVDAHFDRDADFEAAIFSSGNFEGTVFHGVANFRASHFEDRVDFKALEMDGDAVVDFSGATVKGGRIVQPADDWVHYDLTRASLGNVDLEAERKHDHEQLLDYFRFCETQFDEFDGNEFDFSHHVDYLDRNDWVLHTFDDRVGVDHEFPVEMTPEVIEATYLKAKNSASAAGNKKAAGEFRVKRQQYARRKNLAVVRDPEAGLATRGRNLARATENAFLGITCGHGMRLLRIATVFLVTPLFVAGLYAFGGPSFRTSAGQITSLDQLLTAEGQSILYENIHFSYISYTTIGYGNIGPEGALARMLAGTEAYLSAILAALVVYALVKRSEL